MTLTHPRAAAASAEDLSIAPLFTLESHRLPRHELPAGELPPDVAYQIIHDELMLDGNARLNLATFVSTWMEPQAEKLMAECFDKNMIDKDEYPQTAALEVRCVNILSRLWHAPDADQATGCSTTGSSEAAMLGGLALKRRWQQRRRAEGKPIDKPNLVMGINVQVCWEKFANYWDVEMRLVPMEGDRFHLSAEEAVELCDENTIGVVAILGSTFDGSYEPVAEICAALDDLQERTGLDIPVHVDGASGAFVAPFVDPDLVWDFRLPRVASINASGHKYGLVYPGVGWIVWRDAAALPDDLIFWVNYLGDNMPTFALNFSRPGAQVVAQYYNFLRLGFDGLPEGARVLARGRDAPVGSDRGARPVRAADEGRRAAGVRLHAARRHRQLHRLRRLRRAARARLARPCLHVPGEPDRPGRAARRRQAGLHARHGGHARQRPEAAAAASRSSSRIRSTTARPRRASTTDRKGDEMCRWLAYSGSPILIENLLYKPQHSLIDQSLHSQLGAETTNGDGFGIGWYGVGETPGVFHSVEPAWNDRNLRELAAHVESPLVFAHIRASLGLAGPADELPSVPARPLAVDAQRRDPRLPRGQARPRARRRPVALPGDRGLDRLRGASSTSRSRSGSRTTRRPPSRPRSA